MYETIIDINVVRKSLCNVDGGFVKKKMAFYIGNTYAHY